ncbi:unnamed protein product [Lactuca saligna]|uniref:PGG domain-containing protein n=1 Tax=Lactuca saligna TaxID=75948 RepID=A0AA35VF86_LACSI|nr:unnamed protein product [Lactuca saligna]
MIVGSDQPLYEVKLEHTRRESDALNFLKLIWNKISIFPNDEIEQILQGPPLEIEKEKHKRIIYPSRVLFAAAKVGNVRFIIVILQSYPDLIWTVDDKGLTIFHIAVKHRQVNVYNLLYEIGPIKEQITTIEDENGNNMLHLLSETIGPKQFQKLPGVALQMQQELIWFEEVKQMIPLAYRQRKNKQGETPHEIFTKCHEKLVVDGEKWMKETAPQCMVVAALVATVVFAAAFTLPGGYDQDSGLPMFIQKLALTVFVIADAISLISSCTSILFMLSLFISRYSEQDFLETLPKKLFAGLGALFLSVAAMMIAYCASFFLLYNKNFKWVPILITSFSFLVVEVVAFMQMQLQLDVFLLTYSSRYLFKPTKRKLYF